MTLAVALPNWVGDAVMATPTLKALRRAFPDERIVAVGRPYIRPVLKPNAWTDRFIEAEKSVLGLWPPARELRKEQARAGLLLANSARSAVLFRLGGVQRRIGYRRDARGPLLTDPVEPEREGGAFKPVPQIAYYLRLAAELGGPTDDRTMELQTTEADRNAAREAYEAIELDPEDTVLFCPGAAFGPSKAWPVPHWACLAKMIRRKLDLVPAILCPPSDASEVEAIRREADVPVASFHDQGITLASARAVVDMARAMVAIDSGLRHYAAAFDKPVVAMFGPTDIRWTETWHPKEVRLQGVTPCGPCQEPVCPRGESECMWKIKPAEALDALIEALRRDQPEAE